MRASQIKDNPDWKDPASFGRDATTLAIVLLLLGCLYLTEFKPWTLFESQSLKAMAGFVTSFYPPAHSPEFLLLIARSAWKTVAIATAGVTLALLAAIPLALIATRALSVSRIGNDIMDMLPTTLRISVRGILVVLRSVPELVWGLIFVRAVGLGDTAGVMAIALTYCGMMGKVFLEIFESQEAQVTNTLLFNGTGRAQAFLYGLLPSCLPEMVSYTVFRWECAIRSSIILGFVGAGGLGQQMDLSMRMLNGGEAISILAAFVALVAVADLVSRATRKWLD